MDFSSASWRLVLCYLLLKLLRCTFLNPGLHQFWHPVWAISTKILNGRNKTGELREKLEIYNHRFIDWQSFPTALYDSTFLTSFSFWVLHWYLSVPTILSNQLIPVWNSPHSSAEHFMLDTPHAVRTRSGVRRKCKVVRPLLNHKLRNTLIINSSEWKERK